MEEIERYVQILQSNISENVWEEAVRVGGEYGTSIIIHELIQIRSLREAGIEPFKYRPAALQAVLQQHREAHVRALYQEHLYLQEILVKKLGQRYEVATLVKAHYPYNDNDFDMFLESDIGIFLFEEHRVEFARDALEQLKGR